MRLVVVWRRETDYGRDLEAWIREFERRTRQEVENVNPESPEGEQFARAYGVVEYPTILALDDQGVQLAEWRGTLFPTFDEVAYWIFR